MPKWSGAADVAGKADSPLFGYSNGQSIITDPGVPIVGCSVTVEDDTFYEVDVYVKSVDTSISQGQISTTGTATFTGNILYVIRASDGTVSSDGYKSAIILDDATLGTEETIHFTGIIQTTAAGTIILNALSQGAPDNVDIIARMVFTKIGVVMP